MIKENYFLRPYVCTSCADSKRSVSDRWLINEKEAQSALKLTKNYTIINVKYLYMNFLVSVFSFCLVFSDFPCFVNRNTD